MSLYPLKNADGYTVIEILTVIVIAAVVAVSIFAHYRHSDTELKTQTNILKTHIRYAQARAMNADTRWGVRFDVNEQGYWLFQDPDINVRIALPGQTADLVDLGELGLDITGSAFNIRFDSWGRPTLDNRAFINGQLTLNLNRNGENGNDITITENTGFVP